MYKRGTHVKLKTDSADGRFFTDEEVIISGWFASTQLYLITKKDKSIQTHVKATDLTHI